MTGAAWDTSASPDAPNLDGTAGGGTGRGEDDRHADHDDGGGDDGGRSALPDHRGITAGAATIGNQPGGSRHVSPFNAPPTARAQRSRALIVPGRRDCLGQHVAGRVGLAAIEQRPARLEHLFGVTLLFAQRRPRSIDVGASPGVCAVEKQDARPEMNRILVSAVEVAIESIDQQRFGLAVASDLFVRRGREFDASQVGH